MRPPTRVMSGAAGGGGGGHGRKRGTRLNREELKLTLSEVSRDRTNAREGSPRTELCGINARTISTPSHHMHRLYQYYA